jgi:hypothetical protein
MKNPISILIWLATIPTLQNCATITGGNKYNAHVVIKDHPLATIKHNGEFKGSGTAFIQVKRKDANTFSIAVSESGCSEQIINFNKRSFRGGPFVGTLPWGVAFDLVTGALWKPNIKEPGVAKNDYKNYTYFVDYSGCNQANVSANN